MLPPSLSRSYFPVSISLGEICCGEVREERQQLRLHDNFSTVSPPESNISVRNANGRPQIYFEVLGKGMERPMQTVCGDSFSGWGRKFLSLQSIDFAALCDRNKLGSVHVFGRSLRTHVLRQIASNNHSLTFLSSLANTFVIMHDTFGGLPRWQYDMTWWDLVWKYHNWYHQSSGLSPIILVSNKVQTLLKRASWSHWGLWRRGKDDLTLVVKGFPGTASEATLASHFAVCGEVVRVAWFTSGWPEVMSLKLRTYLSFVDIYRLQMYHLCLWPVLAVRKFCRWPWLGRLSATIGVSANIWLERSKWQCRLQCKEAVVCRNCIDEQHALMIMEFD